MSKLVSVIVPVYQSEQHLQRCLKSITGQTYYNLEIIVIDDGSTDRSPEICDQFSGQDHRVLVIHQQNRGVSAARNKGIEMAAGDYLMFVDADDFLDHTMVEDLMNAIEGASADLAISGFCMVYQDGSPDRIFEPERTYTGSLKNFVKSQMLECYDNFLLNTQCNKLCSAEIIRRHHIRYPADMAINEDIYISMQMLMHSRQIVCVNKAYYYYWQYQKPQSLVTRFNPNGVDTCLILLEVVWNCLKKAQADNRTRNQMNNRMLFHICGFVGLPYYRSDYTNRQCLDEVRKLANNPAFRKLLRETRPFGLKNKTAYLLLKLRFNYAYHLLCLLVYQKKRAEFRRKKE